MLSNWPEYFRKDMAEIGKIKNQRPYYLADILEIVLLTEPDLTEISIGDFKSLVSDLEIKISRPQPNISDTDWNDFLSLRFSEILGQIRLRKNLINASYPFDLDKEVVTRRDGSDGSGDTYKFLLVCSRSKSFRGLWDRNVHGSAFEDLCELAIGAFLPSPWITYRLGAGIHDEDPDRKTMLLDRIESLSEHANFDLSEAAAQELRRKKSSGDAGLDLIGYFPLDDRAKGNPLYTAQCAAYETGWEAKIGQGDARLFQTLSDGYAADPAYLFMIPNFYRENSGDWDETLLLKRACIFDRARICQLVEGKELPASAIAVLQLAELTEADIEEE